jgi:hypothetical protein
MENLTINVHPDIKEMFRKKYSRMNLEKYINTLIRKDLEGYKPELDRVQYIKLKEAADKLNLTIEETLAQILIRIELDINNTPTTKNKPIPERRTRWQRK